MARPRQTALLVPAALRPIDARVESVLFEVHSHMRDVDGLHAPEAVDELCKLLFMKVYDERTTPAGRPLRLQRGVYGSIEERATAARRLYRAGLAKEEQRLGLDAGALARLWGDLILSSAALVRCVDELAGYSIDATALDVKGRAFQSVLRPAARAGLGQYFTPEAVGGMMVAVLDPAPGERVLDPFAGSAHFLTLVAQQVAAGQRDYCRRSLFGIEKSDRMMRIAFSDLMLHHLQGLNLDCGDALGPRPGLGSFDVVITNPPFGSVLRADAIAQLGAYEIAAGRSSTPVEELALERSTKFLHPGGRLGIVLPDGLLGNQRAAAARCWAGARLALRAIISLPPETFVPFGANVKTSVLFARRLRSGEDASPGSRIFLGRVDSVGYDAAGRPTAGEELTAVTGQLRDFLRREGW